MKLRKLITLIPNYRKRKKTNKLVVIFSYINIVYYFSWLKKWMETHGNKKEAIVIKNVFLKKGYNFYSVRFNGTISKNKLSTPNVVFGIEPNFVKLCELFPDSFKVYYATGSYFKHQNSSIVKRTDDVNMRLSSNIPYNRLVDEHDSVLKADLIVQKGTKITLDTYPEEYRHKIRLISHSSFEFLNYNHEEKKKKFEKNRFLWFGSTGSILKGLDLVLDYFSVNTNIILDIVGPIDSAFMEIYKDKIYNCPNIFYHGYLQISSKKMKKIALKNAFIILPSASEGNPPGSVINMMKLGLIPVVTKFAAFDEIEEYGILINSLDNSGIKNAVTYCLSLNNMQLIKMFEKANQYVENNHTLNHFKNDLEKILGEITNKIEV
jgi:hypothetical protein